MSILDRFRLDGRTAILTGVGPGVGEHVAKAYAELGANVVISARSPDRLERIAGEINALQGGRALAVTADAANFFYVKTQQDLGCVETIVLWLEFFLSFG